MYALVDCNNFYASCERLFRPDLAGRPIVVLSNNDGCIIARSSEAKALGLKMAAPLFKNLDLIRAHNVVVFSSNYALYGDISERVMTTLEAMAPDIEIYSIDECFVDMAGIRPEQRLGFGQDMRDQVRRHVGITVGVGIAPSKTLAKMANEAAKQYPKTGGVVDLSDPARQRRLMALMPVDKVWGVGARIARKLSLDGIFTALDLARQPPNKIRKFYNVVLERTVRELNGEPCLALESIASDRKQIVCSRSFGSKVTSQAQLHEALVQYTSRAAEKLRQQSGVCRQMQVFIRTNPHATGMPQYRNMALCNLPQHSADTRLLVHHATHALQQIYRPGYTYLKAGVMLSDIMPVRYQQSDLFQVEGERQAEQLMQVMDRVNQSGLGELYLASRGSNQGWKMKQAHLSPRYTTRWDELPRVS